MIYKTIIAIDPGAGGGIAYFNKGRTTAGEMPGNLIDLYSHLQRIQKENENCIVFIEKVQAFKSDNDEGGKNFGINKMLYNFAQIMALIEILRLDYIHIYPISWQSGLGLKVKNDQRTKTERKNSYKQYAANCFPEAKVTLSTADALCLLQFALTAFTSRTRWIQDRIVKAPPLKLF